MTMTTKHTHQVVWGRRVADCPRCQELAAGASARPGWGDAARRMTHGYNADRRVHDVAACTQAHIICTCFD